MNTNNRIKLISFYYLQIIFLCRNLKLDVHDRYFNLFGFFVWLREEILAHILFFLSTNYMLHSISINILRKFNHKPVIGHKFQNQPIMQLPLWVYTYNTVIVTDLQLFQLISYCSWTHSLRWKSSGDIN